MKGTFMKKVAGITMAAMCMVGGMSTVANAADFEVQYVHHLAGNGANYPNKTVNVTASGGTYCTLNCSYFNQQISGLGYLTESSPIGLRSVSVSGTGTYRLYYSGSGIPRQGTRFSVSLSLNNYSDGNPMCVRGSVN